MRALMLFLFLSLTPVWAISYTVQLFASSDQVRASQLQEELAGQGYLAYLLSVPTPQGQVYRIRVGAFGNRAAAALFAQVISSVEGSTPSPALAEGGVPPIPLQSALVGQVDLETMLVQVFPWPVFESSTPRETTESEADTDSSSEDTDSVNSGNTTSEDTTSSGEQEATASLEETSAEATDASEGATGAESGEANSETSNPEDEDTNNLEQSTVAQADDSENNGEENNSQNVKPLMVVRIQPKDASEQALYRVGSLEFEAWKATPLEDGRILRVRSFSVWPDDWQNAPEAERDQYRETVLANLSGDLDLTPQQLEPFVFELADKAPFVILVERFNPETEQVERLRSIGQPRPNQDNLGLTLEGPSTFLGEAVAIPSPDPATITELNKRTPVPETVEGDGWQAGSDGDFVILTTQDNNAQDKTWRAAVGQALWANRTLLISFYEDQLLLYQIQEP